MTKKVIARILFLGFLSWLIPFVVSLLFFRPGGELVVPYATFKSLIMVTGTLSGCYLFLQFFKVVEGNFVRNGMVVGVSWLAINIILDTVILIPMMKTSFSEYFMSIGIGYLAIPVISTAMGYLLESKVTLV